MPPLAAPLAEAFIHTQIGLMTHREHAEKRSGKKRHRLPPSVELTIPKRTIDVNAWLGKFAERVADRDSEREVTREVHPMADRADRADRAE